MKFLRLVFIFCFLFFVSCRNKTNPVEAVEETETVEEIETADETETVEEIETAEEETATEAADEPDGYSGRSSPPPLWKVEETAAVDQKQNVSKDSYKCNISNYMEFVHDFQKIDRLIAETGMGCYLPEVDFSGEDLSNLVFTNSVLTGAIFKGANLYGAKFINADLRGANFEDTNYQDAYFRSAKLKGAFYNKYNSVTAWLKVLSGQGIRGPADKGMIYTGQ